MVDRTPEEVAASLPPLTDDQVQTIAVLLGSVEEANRGER